MNTGIIRSKNEQRDIGYCVQAVTDFIGALTGKITSMMDSIVGPLLNPINSLFGKLEKKNKMRAA